MGAKFLFFRLFQKSFPISPYQNPGHLPKMHRDTPKKSGNAMDAERKDVFPAESGLAFRENNKRRERK